MGYLLGGIGAFLSLIAYLWRRSVKRSDAVIDDLTAHLEKERKQLYAVIERKNKYIHELETALISRLDPSELALELNTLFGSEPRGES